MLRLAIPKLGDLEAGQIHHKSHVRPTKSMETGNVLYKRPAKQSLHPSGPNWGMCTLKLFGSGEGVRISNGLRMLRTPSGEGRNSTGLLVKVCWVTYAQ